jgi:hypothetical protein
MKTKTREEWLQAAVNHMRKHFQRHAYTIPERVRVSCGLPSTGAFATVKRSTGEAWASTNSADQHFEIFISPTIADAPTVLPTLAHELVHVTVGLKAGHRGHFIECARAIGLVSPWTATHASDDMKLLIDEITTKIGAYPHGTLLRMTTGKKKQTTRLLKVGCATCGYNTRITMQWILVAVPTCPNEHCSSYGALFEVVLPYDDATLPV